MSTKTIIDKLAALPEEDRFKTVKRIVSEGLRSDFGEWVMALIEEQVAQCQAAILSSADPETMWRAGLTLQTLERVKAAIIPREVLND